MAVCCQCLQGDAKARNPVVSGWKHTKIKGFFMKTRKQRARRSLTVCSFQTLIFVTFNIQMYSRNSVAPKCAQRTSSTWWDNLGNEDVHTSTSKGNQRWAGVNNVRPPDVMSPRTSGAKIAPLRILALRYSFFPDPSSGHKSENIVEQCLLLCTPGSGLAMLTMSVWLVFF
jgi:hypothetical protein